MFLKQITRQMVFVCCCILSMISSGAQVGIGTTQPSENAVLELKSTNKGILLPRLTNTGMVSNPSEGLMIYNQATQSPAYHDGTKWNNLLTNSTSSFVAGFHVDSITYTITSAGSGFTDGTHPLLAVGNGLSNTFNPGTNSYGRVSFSNVSIQKGLDSNSIGFSKQIIAGNAMVSMVIEIRFYEQNAATPFYSIKIKGPHTLSYSMSMNTGNLFAENIELSGDIIGYKNWVTNQSIAYNNSSGAIVSY